MLRAPKGETTANFFLGRFHTHSRACEIGTEESVENGKSHENHIEKYLKDHRVFMMACIAALSFGGNWKIADKDSINTSFPSFLDILKSLGAKIN